MTALSRFSVASGHQERPAPPLVHNLVYGIGASLAIWGAIAALAYELL